LDAEQAHRVLASAITVRTEEQVIAALDRMASRITRALESTMPVVLAAMNGGVFTAVELCKRFKFPYEFDYAHATRYRRALVGGELEWRVCLSSNLRNRTVLIVDDVLDEGVTLSALYGGLERVGADRILSAVLVRKDLGHDSAQPHADFIGLEVEDIYLFGCGMDYSGFWRGLPTLYGVVNEES
jgi:hypoxanthine phosphoribosyltransferase